MVGMKNMCLFCVLFFSYFGPYVIVVSQEIQCSDSCPCFCDNISGVLNCSGVGVESLSVCRPQIERFGHLDFSNNGIVNFPNDLVCEASLQFGIDCVIDLSHNIITNLHLSVVQSPSLPDILVDISYNRLSAIGTLLEINYLDWSPIGQSTTVNVNVSHNLISSVPADVIMLRNYDRPRYSPYQFLDLILDLSYNKVIFIQPQLFFSSNMDFVGTTYTVRLLLQNNEMTSFNISSHIENSTNSGRVSNYHISLRDNLLTGFKQSDVVDSSGLSMDLAGNPWHCDCSQRWAADDSSVLSQILKRSGSVGPLCKTPTYVAKRPLLSLSKQDFICPPKEDTSVPRTFHPSEGDTVKLSCPVTRGDPPVEIVKWEILSGRGLNQSFLSLETSANTSLIINNMNQYWQGLYICTVDNGVKVSFALTVNLIDNGSLTTPRANDEVPNVLATPHVKGRPRKGAVIVLSSLLIIAMFSIVAVCVLYCREGRSDNGGVLPSEKARNRHIKTMQVFKTSNKYTVQQPSTDKQPPSTTENTHSNLREPTDAIYENNRHPGMKRSQPGRDVQRHTESTVISVKYDEDMSVYYNFSAPSPKTENSNDYCDATNTDGIEYTELNIHETTKATSAAYQPIICQPKATSNELKIQKGTRR